MRGCASAYLLTPSPRAGEQLHRGVGCRQRGARVQGRVGGPGRKPGVTLGGGGGHVELQLCAWVVVMTRQEQKLFKVRQGEDVGLISGND